MSIHGQNIDVELLDSIINSIKVSGFIFIDGQKVSAQDIINQVKTVKSLLKRAKWANQTIADQKKLVEQLVEAINHWFACVDAAKAEGLDGVLQRTEDERLKDLMERRLFYDTEEVFEIALEQAKKAGY